MSQEVLCPNPSCGKKYRLQGEIPPEFTCTKCGQTMDLSAFAPAPAPKQTGAPSTRSARRGGSSRGARRGREREEEPEEEEGRPRFQPPPKSNNGLIFAGVGVLLLAFILIFLVMRNKEKQEEREQAGLPAAAGTAPVGTPTPGVPAAAGGVVPGGVVPGVPVPGTAPATPGATEPVAPAPASSTRLSSIALRVWDPPAELNVTADEKERIERALDTALNDTGRAVQEAQAVLVGLGRKSIWRVVSQFKHIQDTDTFEKRPGLIDAMVVDRILRSIDGYMERHAKVLDRINPESSPDWATNVARRWNAWLEKGYWKTELKAWDPRVDMQDEAGDAPPPRSGAGGPR